MKNIKFVLMIVFAGLFLFTMNSCKNCKHEDPAARIINNGTAKASVQIKTSGGNTVNINNVQPGTSSEYRSFAPGYITFTIDVNGNDYVEMVDMGECFDYDIAIDNNNKITVVAFDRND